jgi:hypothetical protein
MVEEILLQDGMFLNPVYRYNFFANDTLTILFNLNPTFMRSTRRNGGDNGYRTAENFSNEGRGYERPNSYSDRYRYERDDTDYRGQGNSPNDRDQRFNNGRDNHYYGNNNRNPNTGRREWSNHQSGWNDSGSNWGNRGIQNSNRYNNDGRYPNSDSYERSDQGNAPLRLNNSDNYPFGNRPHPQDNDYGDWQNRNRGNDPYYNSQNDFLEDEEDEFGNRMTNRNGYNENANNDYRRGSTGNNYENPGNYGNKNRHSPYYENTNYGNLWNREENNSSRRSRQGFGSMSKERRQEITNQDNRVSNKNR